MKVIVVGAGIIGVTTAYFLAKAGHEVTVIDRQSGPAMETSFANAGQITPSYTGPWAAPGLIMKALGWIIKDDGPLKVRFGLSLERYQWLFALYRQCTTDRNEQNFRQMMAISCRSKQLLQEIRTTLPLSFDHAAKGNIEVFTNPDNFRAVSQQIGRIREFGLDFQVLDAAAAVALEPGLNRDVLAGAIALPADETGDCHRFTNELATVCQSMGVVFHFNTPVSQLIQRAGRIVGVKAGQDEYLSDKVVLCAGSYTNQLLDGFGIRLPVYPVKGYSLTLPVVNAAQSPQSTVLDDQYKVAITRLGDRIRIGGFAEICGFDLSLPDNRRQILESALLRLFPQIAYQPQDATFWCGLRPMTPTGVPVTGQSGLENLYINTGHGTFGWTMCLGSAERLANEMTSTTKAVAMH
ncbi:D-amino acid dehydrogenase [Leeia oryzae]|uniref:D-amino acid dehydrogenase n=1 Tax=Leeia oryzae TaxID=356662 RepID=UPI0003694B5F|nr:D-amino acid dehydrogenase [Leeia oryzae]